MFDDIIVDKVEEIWTIEFLPPKIVYSEEFLEEMEKFWSVVLTKPPICVNIVKNVR